MDLDKFHQPTLAITRPPTIKHGRLYTEMITTTPEYHKPSGVYQVVFDQAAFPLLICIS